MKIYLTALFALAVLGCPNQSSASGIITQKHEIKSIKVNQVFLGTVTTAGGIIYLWGDGFSGEVVNAEFYSPLSTYTLVSISGGRTGAGIVKGIYTFEDSNGQTKVVLLNNASFD